MTDLPRFKNAAHSTLSASANSGVTSITVASVAALTDTTTKPSWISIWSYPTYTTPADDPNGEVCKVTAWNAGTGELTLSAATSHAHASGDRVAVLVLAEPFNAVVAVVEANESKLAGIETGATADQTANEILTAVKTVDGTGSGLDADLLDGNEATAFSLTDHTHTTVAVTDFDDKVGNHIDVSANSAARHTHSNSTVLNGTEESFTTVLKSKLDGIEPAADVTDATNVEAAGAVMDAEKDVALGIPVLDSDGNLLVKSNRILSAPDGTGYVYLADRTNVRELLRLQSVDNDNTVGAIKTVGNWYNIVTMYNAVIKTSNQSIDGVKTFTSFPITPSAAPTTDYQAANKKYVDDSVPDIPVLSVNTKTGSVVLTQDDVASGTTNKVFTATEQTKLSGIETGADVTDATNVEAAGAVMDSEKDALSGIPILDADGDLLVKGDRLLLTPESNDMYIKARGGYDALRINSAGESISDAYVMNGGYWQKLLTADSGVIRFGDQTIYNVKTFAKFPVTPSSAPTSNYQVANKKYVDDAIPDTLVTSVNTQSGVVVLTLDDIGDGATNKAFTSTEKTKLSGIATGAEVNVNADWNAVAGDAQILNKPTIPSTFDNLSDGTTNKAFTATLLSKLNGIEAAADVTDATNVLAAGAVMNSGDSTIAGVKTFSSFPVTPSSDPTTDYQVANKHYVATAIAALSSAKIASGTFTVTSTEGTSGKSVAHGLGSTPKVCFALDVIGASRYPFFMLKGDEWISLTSGNKYTVTTWDGTNIYFSGDMLVADELYYWVALG